MGLVLRRPSCSEVAEICAQQHRRARVKRRCTEVVDQITRAVMKESVSAALEAPAAKLVYSVGAAFETCGAVVLAIASNTRYARDKDQSVVLSQRIACESEDQTMKVPH